MRCIAAFLLLASIACAQGVGVIQHHDRLPGFVSDEHIDWQNATENIQTSGTTTTAGLTLTSNASFRAQESIMIASSTAPTAVKRVADYVCDGASDQVQIQAAIDSLPASTNGGKIVLSQGNFTIDATINIRGSIHICGQGVYGTQITLDNGANCDMFDGSPVATNYFFVLSDLLIAGNKGNNTSGSGIVCNNQMWDGYVCRVFISSFKEHGVSLAEAWGWRFTDCVIEFNEDTQVELAGGGNAQFTNCKIIQGTTHGIVSAADQLMISNCEIDAGTVAGVSYAIDLQAGADNCVISNVQTDLANGNHFGYRIASDRNSIRGCRINGGTDCIFVSAGTNNSLVGNVLDGMTGEAIDDDGTNTLLWGNDGVDNKMPNSVWLSADDAKVLLGANDTDDASMWWDGAHMRFKSGGGFKLTGGLITGRDSIADSTTKNNLFSTTHYNTAEEDLLALWNYCSNTAAVLRIGGGSGSYNSCSYVQVYVAGDTTTTTGTKVVEITTSGLDVTLGTLSQGGTAVSLAGHSHTASDISDQNAGTDITADLEEETHASEHAVSAADTIFPADPNSDQFLMWDDVPGQLVWSSPAGSGDVVGPGSATDNAIARFDTTTGKLLQNSAVTVDDSGNIATAGTVDGRDVSVDGTKLDGVEASADVTDAANVGAASPNLDNTDASVEWEDANDLDANGDVADDSHNHVIGNIDAFTKAALEGQTSDVADFAEADGDTYTGTHNFGGATQLEIPNSATYSPGTTAGQIGLDTTITSHDGLLRYYDGATEMIIVAVPNADLTTTDNHAVVYSTAKAGLNMEAQAGGGGSTTMDRIVLLPASMNIPASNPAIPDLGLTQHAILFDDTTPESGNWTNLHVNGWAAGTLKADIYYTMAGANTSDKVDFEASVWCMSDGDAADVDTESYDTANAGDTTCPDTAGHLDVLTITLSNTDSITDGDLMAIKVERDADDGTNDTATGDAEVRKVVIYEE